MRISSVVMTPVLLIALASCSVPQRLADPEPPRYEILVFTKTSGWRHASIEVSIEAVRTLGSEHGFSVTATEDGSDFMDLSRYAAVVFLNTTGEVLLSEEQAAFEAYIRGGGGYVGVHAAADTEYDWPWYGGLVGAYFESHPRVQPADVLVTDRRHPATKHLPLRWNHTDEWYDYAVNPRPDVHVLAVVDERTYEGGKMGHDHPIAWAHHYDGGRAFYTGVGHTTESWNDPALLSHVLGGIEWAAGHAEADVTATLASAYREEVLTGELTDPMEIDITTDGRVFIIEWAGSVKIWEPETGKMRVIGWIPVEKNIEDGLLGLALDPDFDDNGWMYIYHSPIAHGKVTNRLSRFTYDGEALNMDSEIVMLEVPVQRVQCCHSGGSVQFDKDGLLYLSTGDNSGGARDHEDVSLRRIADQGRTSANTNDLRGKILRIRPEKDGTYSIPDGNLFEADSLHRGEIYTMGHRNPFRISIDDSTGWVYWGDVGPGTPGGWDEFNQAQEPGFYGWPLFTGFNAVNPDYYVFGEEDMVPYQHADRPINASSFNTGTRVLPPALAAWIPYSYGTSDEFPELGAGGLNPMAGPTFHYDALTAHLRALPQYWDRKVMIYEWMRNWVQVVTVDSVGRIVKIDPFLPGRDWISPIDIEVGPQGRLYIAEWGDEFWGSNANAQLVRVDYWGTEDIPAVPDVAEVAPSGAIRLREPAYGSFFDFDSTMAYIVNLPDRALSDAVTVRTFTGFDTSSMPLETFTALEGSFAISRKYTHTPDVHYVNRFVEIEACLGDDCHRVRLHPRTKEAEHVSQFTLSERKTYSARPASEHWGRTALTVMRVESGTQLAYEPINLDGIVSVTIRFRATANGTLAMSSGDSTVLAVELGAESGEPVTPHQAVYLEGVSPDASGLAQLEKGAFDNWRELTTPVAGPSGANVLTLNFTSEASKLWLELDWLRFNADQ